jgi:dolichol-phosphate mannosyltransferase
VLNESKLKTVIIIPTYNERENIDLLIEELQRQFERMTHEMHILVVDDSSPDGTADAVRVLQSSYANLHLIEGRNAGLGMAYIRGMRHASEQLGADVVFEMDADFSHKPEDVPRLMSEIDAGADFVVGSRYIKGGSVPKDWGLLRRFNSLGGNIAARYIAGITQVKDCTAGFRAIRTSILQRIDLSRLHVQGYAFQVALLHAAVVEGVRIKEVPVDFVNRKYGESKLGLRDILEFIINVWWIRLQSSRTFIRFGMVGLSGVMVNLGFFTLFLAMGVNKYVASPIAIELSIISNFLLNNYWTFRHRKTKDRTRIRGLKFNLVSILALGVSYATFVALSLVFPETAAQVHQLIGIIPATIINYLLNSYWTFGYAHNGKRSGRHRQRGAQEMQGNGDRLGRHAIGADALSAARQKRH